MCGIAGYYLKAGQEGMEAQLVSAISALSRRGPDTQNYAQLTPQAGLGHARLSIIDTSGIANQPMFDDTGRYCIIFNGEIFNFRELREQYLSHIPFRSHSDTEVLLQLYILLGEDCLQHLNGFFAFGIFDKATNKLFLARDRFGIKPLHLYSDERMTVFASELKAIFGFPVKKEIDFNTLALYLQLNYVPGGHGMLKRFTRLQPGHYAFVDATGITIKAYYRVPFTPGQVVTAAEGYDVAKNKLKVLVEEAVQRRLVSDVPLGTFLSGGIDSSIVTACAARHVKHLSTFSIGYKDEPYFDETKYANLVAKRFGTNHTVFAITNDEMFANIFNLLDYLDEPFADSSAIAVYLLTQKTRQKVTVALSGDGGDELFAGYNKHKAELMARQGTLTNSLLKAGLPVFKLFPASRHGKWGNLFRQITRYSEGLHLTPAERYWRWCTLQTQAEALSLLQPKHAAACKEIEARKAEVTGLVKPGGDLNDVLYADTQMVLPNDMLQKVDLMSMANSLEVRVPLLDYTVVNYAFSLPVKYKIDAGTGKKILKEAFAGELPSELFTRPKHGFEVPLLKWMKTGLSGLVEELLGESFLKQQQIFDLQQVLRLKQKLYSNNPGDAQATAWALLVFQHWYKTYFL